MNTALKSSIALGPRPILAVAPDQRRQSGSLLEKQPAAPRKTCKAGWAFFRRELQVALLNRFVHVFCGIGLAAGLAPLFLDNASGDAAPYFLLQAILYLLPLFALLIGTGAAQSDMEERPFLFTQASGRGLSLLGKFFALWSLMAVAALLVVLPSACADTALRPLVFLWLHAVGVAAIFVALGLAAGYSTKDRVKAHLAVLAVWFLCIAGFDLAALALAHLPWMQQHPSLWTGLLMLNPLDALRIGALFSIDRVPLDLSQTPSVARWWLSNLGLWFAVLATVWTGSALAWSRRCTERIV